MPGVVLVRLDEIEKPNHGMTIVKKFKVLIGDESKVGDFQWRPLPMDVVINAQQVIQTLFENQEDFFS